MNTWTPLFSKIVDSSVWMEDDYVVKLFVALMALKDADQIVRYNAYALGKKCWPGDDGAEKKALKALKILSSPDTRRIEPQPYDGRRIERVEDGWLILNGQAYEDMMRKINRRAYKAGKQAEYRARKRVGAAYAEGQTRFVAAVKEGDQEKADAIAAEPAERLEQREQNL